MPFDVAEPSPEQVRAAARGDAAAVRGLVRALTPTVRVAVARALFQHGPRRRAGSVAQEVDDVAQEVFAALFEDGARVLASWDPARGSSLASFVRLVAVRTTVTLLRSGRRTPWKDDPTSESSLEAAAATTPEPPAERAVVTRQLAERLFARLREELSPRGYALFQRVVVDEDAVASVCADLAMSPDAVYAWRSRLVKLCDRIVRELEGESSPAASDSPGPDRRVKERVQPREGALSRNRVPHE